MTERFTIGEPRYFDDTLWQCDVFDGEERIFTAEVVSPREDGPHSVIGEAQTFADFAQQVVDRERLRIIGRWFP